MHRAIAAIMAAILMTQPKMSESTAKSYAKVVQEEAREHYFDPFTLVSMAHYESSWRPGANDGACYGLVGICLSNYRVCQKDRLSDQCQAKKHQLVGGAYNLRTAADLITANRQFCRKRTGQAKFHHWLASYQGANKPSRGVWCGQKKVNGRWEDVEPHRFTKRVMVRRRWLIRKIK